MRKELWVMKREKGRMTDRPRNDDSWNRPNEDLLGVVAMMILLPVCLVVAPIAIVWAVSDKLREAWRR